MPPVDPSEKMGPHMTLELKHLQDLFELRFKAFEDRIINLQASMTRITSAVDEHVRVTMDVELLKLKMETAALQAQVLSQSTQKNTDDIIGLKNEMASTKPIHNGTVVVASLSFAALVGWIVTKITGAS
jgi:hypothetical protein